jgi:hypothetical protein
MSVRQGEKGNGMRHVQVAKTFQQEQMMVRVASWITIHVLTRGPGRLLPSDLAPILQYGSRPPSDFLAKILGVDTSPFL